MGTSRNLNLDDEGQRLPNLPEEHPLRIRLRGTDVASLLCTPDRLEDLAVGWAFAQGIGVSPESGVTLEPGEGETIAILHADPPAAFEWHGYVASGFDARVLGVADVQESNPGSGMRRDAFEAGVREVFDRFRDVRGAGGYHHAALVGEDGILDLAADLSRHNAVDKIVGRAVRRGVSVERTAVVLSGRVTVDIALKAGRLGVPIVASRSLPTVQAVDLASTRGMMLVCRVLDHRRVEYGYHRLID